MFHGHINGKSQFKSIRKFPVLEVLIFVIIFGYLDYGGVVMISQSPSLANEIFTADSTMLVLADIGFMVVILFVGILLVWFNVIIIHGFVEYIRMIGVSLTLLDEGIKIQSRSKEAFVPNSSITHISRSKNKLYLFIVWNGKKEVMTFVVSSKTFGIEAVNDVDSILKERSAYVDDQEHALEILKGIKKFRGILLPFKSLCDIEDGVEAGQ
jgi:hypothetical protein